MSATKVTTLEAKMLRNIAENDYANGDPEAQVWSDCLDCGPCSLDPKSFGGLVASLVKKGLAESNDHGWDAGAGHRDACVWLTEAGLVEWRKLTETA